jgi:ferredoxin
VNAIYAEEDVPDDQRDYIQINRDLAKTWPVITKSIPALPDADVWAEKLPKTQLLNRG